ncbi:hypothetical protein [Streptomyces sp. CAU 1734]|uniref:hypothetical protein n=1 Tax=Streptomyces sp. CAU 1734 TaxID=3140360 RepID=UPI003260C6B6
MSTESITEDPDNGNRAGERTVSTSLLHRDVAGQIAAALPELERPTVENAVAALSGRARRVIHDHLAEHADALVSGSSLAPPAVQRLIRALADAGCPRVQPPQCHRCHRDRPLVRAVEDGRVCAGCAGALAYAASAGTCAECGRTRPLPAQGLCSACYARGLTHRTPKTACAQCGQDRVCRRSRTDGRPLCDTCRPRKPASCSLCRITAQVQARWPLGPVCSTCYARVRANPAPCTACGATRTLTGRIAGAPACGPCSGAAADYACTRCADPADSTIGGLCETCAFDTTAADYFTGLPAAAREQLKPLHDRLTGSGHPRAAHSWLKHSASARLLSRAVASGQPLSHATLDQLGPGRGQAIGYLRDILVDAGVLAPRDEHLASVERRLARIVGAHPRHAEHLHAYGHGSVLPRLRGRERPSTEYVADWANARMTAAAELLTWAHGRSIALDQLAQEHTDQWLGEGTSTRHNVRDFLVWAADDGRAQHLHIPHRDKPAPVAMEARSHWKLLTRCLHDEDGLPLEVRVAGALVLLYGQQATRIVSLARDCLEHRTQDSYLLLGEAPLILPPALTRLIAELAFTHTESAAADPVMSRWLFPNARNRMRHQSAGALTSVLNHHGLTIKPARASALMNAAMDLPPAELSARLGIHLITAEQWRRRAARTWTAYLAADSG